MRHVANVIHEKSPLNALNFHDIERPINFQIAANNINFIDQAIDKIMARGVDIIDLNVGCPARNVIGSGSGSALMADPDRLKLIVTRLREKISIPFTVKIRAGFKECNAIDIAQRLESWGVDAIAIHPRLQTQKFEGRPDYALVAQVKKAVTIPVIVSGGVVNFKTAKMVYEQTGVDGYLIGRGIWGRPWKLQEMREHAAGRPFVVDKSILLTCGLKHLEYLLQFYGPKGLFIFRKHLPFYIAGMADAAQVRKQLVVSTSVDEVRQGLISFLG
jgi:tRNA-dihydrouridine synthase B